MPIACGSNADHASRTSAVIASFLIPIIGVGDLVVAQESPEDGWYAAIVVEANGDMLTLRWRDYPREGRVVRHRKRLAFATTDIQRY
jgi:hypothetical protein